MPPGPLPWAAATEEAHAHFLSYAEPVSIPGPVQVTDRLLLSTQFLDTAS